MIDTLYCIYNTVTVTTVTIGGWSELTYWQRIWDKATRSYGAYGDHAVTNIMINAMSEDDAIAAPMSEFCPANGKNFGIRCEYYRNRRKKNYPIINGVIGNGTVQAVV
jgi:hypothetical protein